MLSSGLTEEQKLVKNLVRSSRERKQSLSPHSSTETAPFPGKSSRSFSTWISRDISCPSATAETASGVFSLSEPESGSDTTSITAGAVKKDGRYISNRDKKPSYERFRCEGRGTFARTDKSKKSRGITAFIVDLDAPGISVGKSESKLGIKAASMSRLVFGD